MGWPGADGMNRDMWDYVSPFESYDYVSRWYEGCHGGAAEPAKVREINAAFAQGRMYFENARAASIVAPRSWPMPNSTDGASARTADGGPSTVALARARPQVNAHADTAPVVNAETADRPAAALVSASMIVLE